MKYAGIGSRVAPAKARQEASSLGRAFALLGFTLRSGAADGMDEAFEAGCDEVKGAKEIFLPYKRFNGHPSPLWREPPEAAYQMAFDLHWDSNKLNSKTIHLHARNVCQVLGEHLTDPSDFIVCWTPDGVICHNDRTSKTGGTGTAISIGDINSVPIYNLNNFASRLALAGFIETLGMKECFTL